MIDLAGAHGRGVMVVARSSNPEGRRLQTALVDEGRGPSVEDMMLADIAILNGGARVPPGTVGAVIGATLAPSAVRLADLGGVILAPGLGAQGGTKAQVAALFAGCPVGSVLPSSSRTLLANGPDVKALASAAHATRDAMAEALA
jgi:orotidine-5'-phosphate decarboxylase